MYQKNVRRSAANQGWLIGVKLVAFALLFSAAFTSKAAIGWFWNATPTDITASNNIASAMNQAVAMFNTYSDYNYDIGVQHNTGVTTADASYHGQIRFGGSISYTVAAHEMCHWLGTGTTGNWGTYRNGNTWEGDYANNAAEAYDGPLAGIWCDPQHYGPYGWNVDGGDGQYPERMVGFVGGFIRDQGLEADGTVGFAPGTYSLRNRVSGKVLDNFGSITDGEQVKQWGYSGSANQQWVLSLIPGTTLFTLRSVATGKYLDSLGNTADSSPIGQAEQNSGPSQQWKVEKTDGGYYQIINVATGKALDTGGQTSDGTGMQGWSPNPSGNQQWKFINTTLASIPAGLLSQYRPVTASSWQGGFLPESGNDGKTSSPGPRWTANGGAYPQWWRVNLGSLCNITNVSVTWFPGVAFQYRIETSTNDSTWTTNVNASANAVQGTTTDNFSTLARYVRVMVTGVNPAGGWAAFYECQVFGTPQTPAAPSGLVATAKSGQRIDLSWADQNGVATYNIKRSTTNGGPYIVVASGVNGASYSDVGLTGGTPYYYVISAANGGGESANSTQASATTSASTLPAAPASLAALPGNNEVVLNWAASAEATGYNVKRGTLNGGPYSLIGTTAALSFTDSTAVNGTTYYYVVSGTNVVGEGLDSVQATATPNTVFAHWKFNETSGTTAVDIIGAKNGSLVGGASWTSGKFGNSVLLNGTDGYVSLPTSFVSSLSGNFSIATWVYVNANSTWARLFDFGTGTTAYMFLAPVSGGGTTRYAITTSGGGGEQQINGPALSAGAWHHVTVTLSGTTGTLYVDGAPVGTNSSMTLKPSNLGSTTLNYIGKSQYNDPYFKGRVDDFRIYNRALTGSEIVALANVDGPPSAPTSCIATSGSNRVDLSWLPVSGATSYKVKRSTESGGPYSIVGTPTATTYTDLTAVNGTTYYYVVVAVNGAGDSPNSAQFAVTPGAIYAHWKFNETSGTTANDSAGTRHGTVVGGSWAVGKINNAVALVGANNSYVTLPTGVVSSLNDFSIATWVFVDANRTWARVFDFGTGTGNYMFLSPSSGGNTVRYAITTGSDEQPINSTSVLSPGAWHHLVVTLSGTTGKLYVDGVAVGTNSSMTLKPSSLGSTTQNYIGKSQWPDPLFNGRVDDFRIYSRALSDTEVSLLASQSGVVPAAPTSLVAVPGDGQAGLSWAASVGAISYNVKRSLTNGGPYTTITNVATTSFNNTGLVNGNTYYYVISASNISGESINSPQASATLISTAPVDLSMSLSTSNLNLWWPPDHTGWRLQTQTNGLSATNWYDVLNANQTNMISFPVGTQETSVFFRLVYP